MTKVKAIVSFTGLKIAMACGEVRDISDPSLVENLIKAGHVIEVVETHQKAIPVPEPQPVPEPKNEPKTAKKSSGKGKKS